jgi:myo-inositol 2-dehydrogenase/D-chiro-inositol 1-dehydrogenase
MRPLRVAVIGCGRMGRERLRAARAWGAEIAGVYDADPDRANAAGAPLLTGPDDVLRSACDAVFVCTPPSERESYALAAIQSGAALFVEKPIGPSAAAVQAITDALEVSPVLTGVGYMNRYRASVQLAARVLANRQVIGAAGFWVCGSYRVPWWLDSAASGGPHNEQATHLYDLCRLLLGEVQKVTACFHQPAAGAPLAAATALRFRSGATGTVFYSCQAAAKDIGLRVFTPDGSLFLSGWDLRLAENTIDGALAAEAGPEDIFLVETSAFLDAVATGDPSSIRCDWADALRTQALVDAAATTSVTGDERDCERRLALPDAAVPARG